MATATTSKNLNAVDTVHSVYGATSSTYPAENAYTGTDSTTYFRVGLVTGSNAVTELYMTFDFSAIPEGATILSTSASVKAGVTNVTSSNVATHTMRLVSGTTGNGTGQTIPQVSGSNQPSVLSFTGATWTRETLQSAGIKFYCKRGTSNTSTAYYIRVYGAEMSATYEYNDVQYTITVSNSTQATVTASDPTPHEGDDVTITSDTLNGITVEDNGTDVTNQFVQAGSKTASSYPTSATAAGLSSANYADAIGRGADWDGSPGADTVTATATIDYSFSLDVPSNAAILNVSVALKARASAAFSAVVMCGETARGNPKTLTNTLEVHNLDTGTWTASELSQGAIRITGSAMFITIAVSGATWTVTYEVDGYVYTITNVTANHVIVVSNAQTDAIYFNNNGTWTKASKAFKKVSGAWAEQSNLTTVFDSNKSWVRGK